MYESKRETMWGQLAHRLLKVRQKLKKSVYRNFWRCLYADITTEVTLPEATVNYPYAQKTESKTT